MFDQPSYIYVNICKHIHLHTHVAWPHIYLSFCLCTYLPIYLSISLSNDLPSYKLGNAARKDTGCFAIRHFWCASGHVALLDAISWMFLLHPFMCLGVHHDTHTQIYIYILCVCLWVRTISCLCAALCMSKKMTLITAALDAHHPSPQPQRMSRNASKER